MNNIKLNLTSPIWVTGVRGRSGNTRRRGHSLFADLTRTMPDNRNIRSAAFAIIDEHGREALVRANKRIEQLRDEGNVDGVLAWMRIVNVLKELMAQRFPP